MSRAKLIGAIFALPMLLAGAGSAQANIIGLAIDDSGSISAGDFALQRDGYVAALGSLLGPSNYGQNSIGVWKFATGVTPVFALQKINNAADELALLTAIGAMTHLGGTTHIGDAINTAAADLNAFAIGAECTGVFAGTCGNKIIDVSTDGVPNGGFNAFTASDNAGAAGIKVNCLRVGSGGTCDFNNGEGDDYVAVDFDAFEAAIKAKLSVELTGVPEPMTLALFGAGLVGAGAMRRRLKKA